MRFTKLSVFACVTLLLVTMVGCAGPKIASPDQLTAPEPIHGNTGKYMCPYTSDDVLAEWVDNSLKASAAGSIGGAVGAYAGAKALEQVPFVGAFIGKSVGNKVGKEIAIKAAGGREVITNTSDQSFNNLNDLAVFMYVKYSTNEHYQSALKAAYGIYPEFKQQYSAALYRASRAVR